MNKEDKLYKVTKIILTGLTITAVISVSLGVIETISSGFASYGAIYEYLYGVTITVGILVILVKLWMLPSVNENMNLKVSKTCKSIGNIFLVEFFCELIHGILSDKGDRIFEIFNIRVSVLLLIFLLCAFAFMSVAKLLIKYVELQEDSNLTI